MATELENLSQDNFSIIDTSDSLGNPDLLSFFDEDQTDPEKNKKPEVEKKTTIPTKEEPKKEEKKDLKKALKDFLTDEKEEEGKEESEKKIPEEEKEINENPFASLSKDLFELGVFSKTPGEEEVEIKTPEDFLDRFHLETKKGADLRITNFLSQFGEDYQQAFEAIYVKGVDPKEYFTTYNEIENVATLDLKVEDNQIAIIKQALLDQEFEPEEITKEIERLKSYGDLETVATRYQKTLVKKNLTKLETLEKETANKIQVEKAKKVQYIKNVQTVLQDKLKAKEFDGIPLNPQLATELQDFLITDKYKSPTGEILTEFDRTILDLKLPENHQKKVKVALLMKLLEKDPNLSTIQNTGITKKTNTLFGEISKLNKKSPIIKEQTKESESSWFS